MDLLWPGFLLLLALIPALIGLYIWMLRRRRRYAVRFSSLSLVRAALPQQSQWRRHLPFALFLLALATLILAVSRPVSIISVPAGQATIAKTSTGGVASGFRDISATALNSAISGSIFPCVAFLLRLTQ